MTVKETFQFDAEVDKIFQLVIHSLYEKKEIFLRELISNASDACDKLRYKSLEKQELIADNPEFAIKIISDPENNTLTIWDNGIGMNRTDLVKNLGTIARSGTQNFLSKLTGDSKKDAQLIGQFGVGFYSAFMVADKITVASRAAGAKKTHIWESTGNSKYSIIEADKPRETRGTTVTLHLKEDAIEYLDKHRIEFIVNSYSNHVAFNILLVDQEGNETILNDGRALWRKNKSDITDEEYKEFYNSISHSGSEEEPWLTLHNKVEGTLEYTNLLFIPSQKPFNLYHPDRITEVKLYVKRVFIADDSLEIIPRWLRFIRGVVDSEDLSLNISRETIQNNQTVFKIRHALVKRILSELTKKADKDPESYTEFWNNFGPVIKEGLCDGMERRDDILEICRFKTTKSNGKLISLKEYMERMPENQETIYFITGEEGSVESSPQLEGFRKRDVEVLLLTDSVDQFWVNVLFSYKGTELKSATRSSGDFDNTETSDEKNDEDKKAAEQDNTDLTKIGEHNAGQLIGFIEDALGDTVKEVRTTSMLTDSPVCLTVPEGAIDIRMERFMVENKQLPQVSAKIFEINPEHQIIIKLADDLANNAPPAKLSDTVHLLFAQANIIEGEPIPDISNFTKRMNSVIEKALAA